jgi:hypothetical protein
MGMRKVGMVPHVLGHPKRRGINDPMGKLHRQAIARVSQVPKAADGFPNSTPGNDDPIVKKDSR